MLAGGCVFWLGVCCTWLADEIGSSVGFLVPDIMRLKSLSESSREARELRTGRFLVFYCI